MVVVLILVIMIKVIIFLFFKKIYKRLGEQTLCIFLFKKIKIFSYTFRKLLFIIL